MKSYYEKDIAKTLWTQFPDRYTLEKAKDIVERYYHIMEDIGWIWSPEEWAEKLDAAVQQGITPEIWEKNNQAMHPASSTEQDLNNLYIQHVLENAKEEFRAHKVQSLITKASPQLVYSPYSVHTLLGGWAKAQQLEGTKHEDQNVESLLFMDMIVKKIKEEMDLQIRIHSK